MFYCVFSKCFTITQKLIVIPKNHEIAIILHDDIKKKISFSYVNNTINDTTHKHTICFNWNWLLFWWPIRLFKKRKKQTAWQILRVISIQPLHHPATPPLFRKIASTFTIVCAHSPSNRKTNEIIIVVNCPSSAFDSPPPICCCWRWRLLRFGDLKQKVML